MRLPQILQFSAWTSYNEASCPYSKCKIIIWWKLPDISSCLLPFYRVSETHHNLRQKPQEFETVFKTCGAISGQSYRTRGSKRLQIHVISEQRHIVRPPGSLHCFGVCFPIHSGSIVCGIPFFLMAHWPPVREYRELCMDSEYGRNSLLGDSSTSFQSKGKYKGWGQRLGASPNLH